MLETIKTKILEKYKPDEKRGLFLSLFDKDNLLLTSNGVLSTDKPLDQLIDLLYHGIVEKYPNCTYIVADFPGALKLQKDAATLLKSSVVEQGICLISSDDTKSGVLLPGTPGVNDMKTAITLVKEKFGLTGNVQIYTFPSDKIMIQNQ